MNPRPDIAEEPIPPEQLGPNARAAALIYAAIGTISLLVTLGLIVLYIFG